MNVLDFCNGLNPHLYARQNLDTERPKDVNNAERKAQHVGEKCDIQQDI